MPNLIVIFAFFISDQKYTFWVDLVQKIKIVSFSRNLVARLIWICRINFSVFNWKYPFWANLAKKIKIGSSGLNLSPRLILICRIQWCCSFFFPVQLDQQVLSKESIWHYEVKDFVVLSLGTEKCYGENKKEHSNTACNANVYLFSLVAYAAYCLFFVKCFIYYWKAI